MLRYARFALIVGFAAAIPVMPQQPMPQRQDKQEAKDASRKKAEPAKKDGAAKDSDDRISRMKERDREIDRRLNQQKK